MPTRRVTVVIVSWNTRDLLERCLRSLAPEVARGMADVWVVDNASSDGSAELVAKCFGWAHLVSSPDNLGFGRAVNLVAKRTATEWLAPSNADIALRPGALDALLEAGARDPGAGAIAPGLVLPDGSLQHSCFAFPTIPFSLMLATAAFRLSATLGDRFAMPGHWDMSRARRVPWAVGAFLLVRREAWDEVGGFDERQWLYAEDLDLGWRLRKAGWATRYEPHALVDHHHAAATTQAFGVEVAPHWQRSTYGFLVRRRGVAYVWGIALLNFAGAAWRWARVAAHSAGSPELAEHRRAHARWMLVHLKALRRRSTLEALR